MFEAGNVRKCLHPVRRYVALLGAVSFSFVRVHTICKWNSCVYEVCYTRKAVCAGGHL